MYTQSPLLDRQRRAYVIALSVRLSVCLYVTLFIFSPNTGFYTQRKPLSKSNTRFTQAHLHPDISYIMPLTTCKNKRLSIFILLQVCIYTLIN